MTQLYSPGSVYAITPCTEEVARAVAAKIRTDPVSLLGIDPQLPAAREDDEDEEVERYCKHQVPFSMDCPECEGGGEG